MTDESVRMTLLVDNEGPAELSVEHGLSVWIESGEQRILFDTGQGAAHEANALRLGIDLSLASTLVLSHGHYDHTGGVAGFLALNSHARVVFGHGLGTPRFSCHPGQAPRAIDIGGLHLLNASAERLEQTVRFIADCAPDYLIQCHCTGKHVVEQLRQVFGSERVKLGQAGEKYALG